MGIVIGETCEIGNDVTIYQGVTLGGTEKKKGNDIQRSMIMFSLQQAQRCLVPLQLARIVKSARVQLS